MQITNNSEGPRGVNALVNKQPVTVILHPGEMRDLTLVDEDCPVFAGMVRSRDFLVEQPQAAAPARKVVNEDGPPVMIHDDKAEKSDKADKVMADDKSPKK
jgi:2-keto-3-deoxy-galactonokinase